MQGLQDISIKTVNKVIKSIKAGIEIPQYRLRQSLLDDYKQDMLKLVKKDLSAVKIHKQLVRGGFKGFYTTVKKYVSKLKRKDNIFVRMHKEPGEETQVDFGYLGMSRDDSGKHRKI